MDATVFIGTAAQLFSRVRTVDRHHQRALEWLSFVGQAHGKIIAGTHHRRVAFGGELESETQWAVALALPRLTGRDQALRAACEEIARATGLPATRPQRRDRVEPFFFQVLIELLRGESDHARIAAIADDDQPGNRDADEAGRVRAVTSDHRL